MFTFYVWMLLKYCLHFRICVVLALKKYYKIKSFL